MYYYSEKEIQLEARMSGSNSVLPFKNYDLEDTTQSLYSSLNSEFSMERDRIILIFLTSNLLSLVHRRLSINLTQFKFEWEKKRNKENDTEVAR